MSQELQYLREEQSQFMRVHAEQTNKVVSLMLLVWGAFLVVLGNNYGNFLVPDQDNLQLYFIGASIFFISMVVLYSLANKYYHIACDIFNIVAYILVFYERRPSSTVKVSDNFCWQTVNCEIALKNKKWTKFMSGLRSRDNEYFVLALVSIFFELVFVVQFFREQNLSLDNAFVYLCGCYILGSMYLFYMVYKYTRDYFNIIIDNVNKYFNYWIDDIGHNAEEFEQELKNRFGKFYDDCIKYQKKDTSPDDKDTLTPPQGKDAPLQGAG